MIRSFISPGHREILLKLNCNVFFFFFFPHVIFPPPVCFLNKQKAGDANKQRDEGPRHLSSCVPAQ